MRRRETKRVSKSSAIDEDRALTVFDVQDCR
jgi:hypothetical protein